MSGAAPPQSSPVARIQYAQPFSTSAITLEVEPPVLHARVLEFSSIAIPVQKDECLSASLTS